MDNKEPEAKKPQPKKEEIKKCGRCGSPMKKNLEKQVWECTNPNCGYDEAF
ncbi:hypothetical protein ES702_07156 [subsurface metagenome]